jgi:hypothetical protein
MSSFKTHKQRESKSCILKPYQQELDRAPRQFIDFMNEDCDTFDGNNSSHERNRFSEICRIYLDGLSIDDIKYLHPEDVINLVPPEQYKHKLLMSIMVRRYLYTSSEFSKHNDKNDDYDENKEYMEHKEHREYKDHKEHKEHKDYKERKSDNNDDRRNRYDTCDNSSTIEYACNKCNHICTDIKCKHQCENYVKINHKQ